MIGLQRGACFYQGVRASLVLIKFKMSERRSIMSWGNWESSVNLAELLEGSSRIGGRSKEDSISQGFRLAFQPEQELLPFHVSINENAVSFEDLSSGVKSLPSLVNAISPNINQTRDANIQNWAPTRILGKRGLRQLAYLLLKVIHRRRYSSQHQITQQIESLINQPFLSNRPKNDRNEEKNIKRRIYDALNVMISAGVLQIGIDQVEEQNGPKNYTVPDRKTTLAQSISKLDDRVRRKQELLNKLESQYQAMRRWLGKKKRQQTAASKLHFPFFALVRKSSSRLLMEIQQELLLLRYSNSSFLSETDLIEEVYRIDSPEQKQQQTAMKFEFQQNQITIV